MPIFDILGLIPPDLQRQIADTLVDFVSQQAKKFLGDQVANKLKKLRSNATFAKAFEEGLQRAAERFARDYETEDEDLVTAIAADEGFFENQEIQRALLAVIKKPGIHLEDEREKVLQSFGTVLPGRKNRERVDRAVTVFLKCLAEELWTLPELRGVYALQFQRMTAEATRQQVELQKAQLQTTIGLSADIQQALLQLTDAMAAQKLLPDSRIPALPAPPQVYHNLPNPDYGTFVGREAELAQVHQLLSPKSRHFLVTVDGIGGIGKSALALEVAHHYLRDYDNLPLEERFEAIIWASAKSEVLTVDGIAPRQQITRTLEDIYTTIAVTLEREDIIRAGSEEQKELVTRALTRRRTLLIVDNLETVDDERVNAFLRELPAPTKAIVTTRHRIDVAYPMRLTGMPKEDGLALIVQECAKKGVTLTDAEAERLYDRTGGVPLAIVWSVAQMGYGYEVETVLRRLGQPTSDIARFCFEGVVERIRGSDAHNLLMALSLFATDASREAVGQVAGLGEDLMGRDEGLVVLERLSLLNRQAGRFSLLPLTRSYLASELEQVPEFGQSAFERMLTHYEQLVMPPPEIQVGTPYWDGLRNYPGVQDLKVEWGNLSQLIHRALDEHRYESALDLFLPVLHNLNGLGLWDDRLELCYRMCHAANVLGDHSEAWLWIDGIGWVLLQRQRFSECMQALRKGRVLARQFDLTDALILADVWEARLYCGEGDMEAASKKIESVLRQLDLDSVLKQGSQMQRLIAQRAVSAAAMLSDLAGDYVRAKEWHERALKLRRASGAGPSPTLTSLGHIGLRLNDDVDTVERLFVQAIPTAGPRDSASINYGLALIAERRGNLLEARHLAELALSQFNELGQKSQAQDVQQLLMRLEK